MKSAGPLTRTVAAAVAFVILAVLPACGDDDAGVSTSPIATLRTATPEPENALSACRLITSEEAETLLGPLHLVENSDPSICLYHGEAAVITIATRSLDPGSAAVDFDAQVAEKGGSVLDDVGDGAFWVPVARKIYVRFGSDQIEISVPHTLTLDESLEVLLGLAAASEARLGA